ncbi:UNVERIFIED_CONTAM: hypothetical protein Sindi_2889800 [Sesamum indicum]
MEILDKCDKGPKRIDLKLLTPEEEKEWLRNFEVRQVLPGNVVRRLHSTKVHGRIPARRNGTDTSKISQDLREIQKTVQDYGHRLIHIPMKIETLSQKVDEILKILPDLYKGLTDLRIEITDLKKNQRESPETSRSRQERIKDALGTIYKIMEVTRADLSDLQELAESFSQLGIVDLVNIQTNEITPVLPPPEGSTCSNDPPQDEPMRETIKIAATTLELDKENFIKLVELSLEGSVKIGWDNTPEDTKASILAGDSKGAIADRLGRLIKIHFIGDGYFEGSRAEKAREYAQALFSLELRSICSVDEYINCFRKYFFQSGVATEVAAPMFFAKICSPWREMLIQSYKENQVSRGKGGSKTVTATPGVPRGPFPDGDHGGPSLKPERTNLDKEQDQQGLHPKDPDEQMQDPPDERLQEELSDGPIPEQMKVLKTAIAGLPEQKDIYLPIARRNMVN